MRESKQGQLENGLYIFAKKKLLKKDLEEKGKKIGVEKPNNESVASTLAKDSHHLRFWKRKLSQKRLQSLVKLFEQLNSRSIWYFNRWLCLRLTKNCFKNWKQWVSLLIRATIGSTSALHFSGCEFCYLLLCLLNVHIQAKILQHLNPACFLSIGFWLTNKQSLPRFGLGRLLMYEASRDWMEKIRITPTMKCDCPDNCQETTLPNDFTDQTMQEFLSCKAMAKQQ